MHDIYTICSSSSVFLVTMQHLQTPTTTTTIHTVTQHIDLHSVSNIYIVIAMFTDNDKNTDRSRDSYTCT